MKQKQKIIIPSIQTKEEFEKYCKIFTDSLEDSQKALLDEIVRAYHSE